MQFEETAAPPSHCPICQDDRQYLGPNGQEWTTLPDLARTSRNITRPIETGIIGIATEPVFAIGQRAMLIRDPAGNILWDCITFIDDETVEILKARGGLAAIALSHPHYYSSIVEWSRRLGGVPVYLHADDADWVMRRDPRIVFWSGERREILPGATLIRVGGTFPAPPCFTGRQALPAKARFTPVTRCTWRRTSDTSASCTAIRISSRCRHPPSGGSLKPLIPFSSIASMAPGGTQWCRRARRWPWRCPRSDTSTPLPNSPPRFRREGSVHRFKGESKALLGRGEKARRGARSSGPGAGRDQVRSTALAAWSGLRPPFRGTPRSWASSRPWLRKNLAQPRHGAYKSCKEEAGREGDHGNHGGLGQGRHQELVQGHRDGHEYRRMEHVHAEGVGREEARHQGRSVHPLAVQRDEPEAD